MTTVAAELIERTTAARAAARALAKLPTEAKNRALLAIAESLEKQQADVIAANNIDLAAGRQAGLAESLLDRLMLNRERLVGMAKDVRSVAALPDPVGEAYDARTLPNGLRIERRRVPLGVIGVIYEARPNVTTDIVSLCLKSGNAVVLRGGKEAFNSNQALVKLIRMALANFGVTPEIVQFVTSTDRAIVEQMVKLDEHIDLLIPRGGINLIKFVREEATMPAITGGIGVVHAFVDATADEKKAVEIIHNSKVQRPSVCNALDTMLIHASAAPRLLQPIARRLIGAGVELRCDQRAISLLGPIDERHVKAAAPDDFGQEFLALVMSVRVVDSMSEAIEHIERHGSGHTETIVTEDYTNAMRFLDEVDAAVVEVNASTRFNDGGQLGLGAEVAISTNKLHARGPMGLRELTSYKWIVLGDGQVRP
ncbi:MAG: glutamate-5-semialdehyde dehydrogenase [SAR202 cluster bacterium]|nr:glutamate-5-semialdehyde dehydrogenase [SAR202 cluster bacterium]